MFKTKYERDVQAVYDEFLIEEKRKKQKIKDKEDKDGKEEKKEDKEVELDELSLERIVGKASKKSLPDYATALFKKIRTILNKAEEEIDRQHFDKGTPMDKEIKEKIRQVKDDVQELCTDLKKYKVTKKKEDKEEVKDDAMTTSDMDLQPMRLTTDIDMEEPEMPEKI